MVRVEAATVNRTDCAMLRANPFIMRFVVGLFTPKKATLGTDFSGQIEAIGKDVQNFRVGDRVFGFDDSGLESHAEFLTISADKAVIHIPEGLSYAQAAASAEGFHYANNIVNKVDIKTGDTILVNGATGAIGSATVQILASMGAEVIAVCHGKDRELVTSLGARRVIDYSQEDFTQEDQLYAYVFDTVGKSSFGACKPLLKDKGVYISSELGWMAENAFFALITPLFGKKKVIFPIPTDPKASLRFVSELIQQGKFTAVIDRTYSLAQIPDAFSYVEKGQKIGNVVIQVGSLSH